VENFKVRRIEGTSMPALGRGEGEQAKRGEGERGSGEIKEQWTSTDYDLQDRINGLGQA